MPVEPYTNPDITTYTGIFNWVPSGANGNDVGFGFKPTVIKRGRFSNDYINQSGHTLNISTVGIWSGQPEYPIQCAFRPLQNPDQATFIAPTLPYIIRPEEDGNLEYKLMFCTPSGQPEQRRISAITIDYNLIIDNPYDENIINNLYSDDQLLVKSGNIGSIDWSKYSWIAFETISGANYTEYPPYTNIPSELKVTGTEAGVNTYRNLTIRCGEHNFGEEYPLCDGIRFVNRYNISSLQFQINKLMLFEVEANTIRDRVNIDYDQVPCSYLQYCFLVNMQYSPLTRSSIVPTGNGPNFHVKVFAPENKYFDGKSGFAHSTELRFLIFSIPAFGISPFDITMAGLLQDMSAPGAFYTVFVGPIAGKKTVRYFCSSDIIKPSQSKIIRLDYNPIQDGTLNITLQRATNYSGETPPDQNNTVWEDIFSLNTNNMPDPNKDSEEGYVSPYIYAIKEQQTQWYRTIQFDTNNYPNIGIPTTLDTWSDNTIFSLYESTSQPSVTGEFSITKRIDSIHNQPITKKDFDKITPFATFVVPTNISISSPISVVKGCWNMSYTAHCNNTDYTNTHIYTRMWFVPDTPSDAIYNANVNPDYQRKTEITFEYDENQSSGKKSQVIIGKAPSKNWVDEINISPPLNTNPNSFYIRRYVDIAKQNNKEVDQFVFPYGDNINGCMVVAFYQITYITDEGKIKLQNENKILNNNSPNLPVINLRFDGASDGVETTLRQIQSHRFLYERANNYIDSSYVGINTVPLVATRNIYGIGSMPPISQNYPETIYNTNYPSKNDSSSFYGLLMLQESTNISDNIDIVVPYSYISDTKENANTFYADCVTSLPSLGFGKVSAGDWQVDIQTSNNFIQNQYIQSEYRLELFLGDNNGKVTERIYISDWTSEESKTFTFSLGMEFVISSGNIQLITRITSRAWSANGTNIDIQSLQNKMSADGPLYYVGFHIKKIHIIKNTIQRLKINQNIYAGGSPAYYEDLPLIPGPDIGGNEGYYVAAKENLVIAITFADKIWPVSGCFYSPIWQHYLPQDVEVDFRYDAYLNNGGARASKYLRFRTVPSKAPAGVTEFLSVGADIDSSSTRTQIVKPSVDSKNNDNAIKYYTQSNVYSVNDIQISKEIGDSNSKVYMSYPDVVVQETEGSTHIIVAGNTFGNSKDDLIVKSVGSNNAGWIFNNQGRNTSDLSMPSAISKSLMFTKIAKSSCGNRIYVAGWINPGVIAVKSSDIQYAGVNIDPLGGYWIVDGDSSNLTLDARKYLPMGNINNKCTKDFPGFAISNGGVMAVAYTIEGKPGELMMRLAQESMRFEAPIYTIISFKEWGLSQYTQLPIYAPNLLWVYELNTLYTSFWCGGKIFVTQIGSISKYGTTLAPIILVAGNHNLSDASNNANRLFEILENKGYLINNSHNKSKDVPRQRCGMIFQNGLYIYFLDDALKLNVAPINGQYVGEAMSLESNDRT